MGICIMENQTVSEHRHIIFDCVLLKTMHNSANNVSNLTLCHKQYPIYDIRQLLLNARMVNRMMKGLQGNKTNLTKNVQSFLMLPLHSGSLSFIIY